MADTLVELLAEHAVRLRSLAPGRNEHVTCPKCDGGRTREKSLSVTVDADGLGATWVCHRGKCGWADGARLEPAKPQRKPLAAAPQPEPRSWFWQWFADRRIGSRTVREFGIYEDPARFFPELRNKHQAIVFPYTLAGALVNRKYRAEPGKKGMAQEKDAIPSLYNWDRASATGELVWVEGEMDCLALFECGIVNGVSLKDGASRAATRSDKRFAALKTHEEGLKAIKRIVLAGDMDEPGLAQREELARGLGRHRCWLADWPAGCKDCNETLVEHGPDVVQATLAAARPYPLEGMLTITPEELDALASSTPPAVMTTGLNVTDAILALPTEGRLIVVSGYPSHGKSNWLRFIMLHTARHHGRRWAVFSPEMQPWQIYASECVEVLTGKRFWGGGITGAERRQAAEFLREHVVMLAADGMQTSPTVAWLLEMGAAAVAQRGITDLAIDPWNEVDQTRPVNVSETEFIGDSLRRCRQFNLSHGCNVWIAAHPVKPSPDARAKPPVGYDLAGSAYWANRSDLGLTIYSPCAGTAQLFIWKSRSKRWGRRDEFATMSFDRETGRYSEPPTKWDEP